MDSMYSVKVDERRNRIYLQCDRELLFGMAHVLNSLLDITRIVRTRQVLVRQREERRAIPLRAKKEKAAVKQAAAVHRVYYQHFNNGCSGNKAEAIRAAARDLGMLHVDVQAFLQIYREYQKREATC